MAKARELLADGIDPSAAKKDANAEKAALSVNTFAAVALEWHTIKAKSIRDSEWFVLFIKCSW